MSSDGETAIGERARSSAPTPADEPDGRLDEAWQRALERWEDDAAHERFVALADLLDRLGEAGRRYRAMREADPSRRADVERRIQLVLARAMARVEVDRARPTSARSRVEWIGIGLSIVLITAAIVALLRMAAR